MMEWNMEHLQTQNLFMKNKLNTDFPSVEQNGGPFNRVDKQHPQTILVLRKRENFKQFLRGNLARKRMPGHNKSSKNGNYSFFLLLLLLLGPRRIELKTHQLIMKILRVSSFHWKWSLRFAHSLPRTQWSSCLCSSEIFTGSGFVLIVLCAHSCSVCVATKLFSCHL